MKGFVDDIAVLTEKNADFPRAPPEHADRTVRATKSAAEAAKSISTARRPNRPDDRESNNDR